MRIRALTLADLPVVKQLYRQMLDENTQAATLRYPQWDDTTPDQMVDFLFRSLTTPDFHGWVGRVGVVGNSTVDADGVVHGGKPKAMIFGSIYERPIGRPRWVGHCDLLYVDPSHRGGKVLARLIQALAAEAKRRQPDLVFEGSYVPGTLGERLWRRLGLRPYVVWCAYVDAEGKPLPDDFFGGGNGKHLRRAGRAGEQPEVPVVDG